ncbi:IS1380-Spn1 transposase [Streptococcus pneumoniae]|nr:IS1380-Spn1 transposase [Streptococcus pneumoniae]
MNSLPNHHFQNKSFYQLSFDGGHLTQYGGLIFFQELFSQLKLKERISKYLVTNDQRRYCRYSDSDILVQFLFQLLTGYGTDYFEQDASSSSNCLVSMPIPNCFQHFILGLEKST